MPQKLTESVEDKVRKYIVQNADPSGLGGYDPTQSDTTQPDYILITSDNDNYGDYYPLIYVSENDNGPILPNSGTTNANGIAGNGDGTNQYTIYNVTISVQAVENGPYLNGVDYDDLVFTIYQEVHSLFGSGTQIDETLWVGELTPGTQTRNTEETDSGSTETWTQRQGNLPVGVQYTP